MITLPQATGQHRAAWELYQLGCSKLREAKALAAEADRLTQAASRDQQRARDLRTQAQFAPNADELRLQADTAWGDGGRLRVQADEQRRRAADMEQEARSMKAQATKAMDHANALIQQALDA